MKTRFTFLFFITLAVRFAFGQAAVTTPNGTLISNQGGNAAMPASAILEMRSNNKGMLPPRMTTAQINSIASPAKGLMAYDTEQNCLKAYDGAKWECLGGTAAAAPSTPLSSSFAYQSITDNDTYPKAISADNSGNTVSVGSFRGAVTFGKNTNSMTLTSLGDYDGFIVKHDPDGNLLWATQIGGSTSIQDILDVDVDNAGNVAVTGYLRGTSTFYSTNGASSSYTTNSSSYYQIFVAKYNPSGILQWFKTASSSGNYNCEGKGVVFDGTGNIFFTGYYRGSVAFGGQTLSSISNTDDIFIAKLNISGDYTWIKTAGGTSNTEGGFELACDNSNNVYLLGYYTGTANFGENASVVSYTSRGEDDIFLAKYDPNGGLTWARTAGSIYSDYQRNYQYNFHGNIAYSSAANAIYISGSYRSTLTFGPGLGSNPLASVGGSTGYYNGFLAKYDLNGNIQWSVRNGSTSNRDNYTTGISIDNFGNPYVTGSLQYDSYFYSYNSATNYYIRGVDYGEPYLAKYNTSGALQWVIAAVDGADEILTIGLIIKNNTANVFGSFRDTINFGYQQLTCNNNNYNGNLFIWRYKE